MMTPLMMQKLMNPTMANPSVAAAMHASAAIKSQQVASQRKVDARIYVGSLHYDLTEKDIRGVFEAFGTITDVTMSHEPSTGKSKGFCFIEYGAPEHAEAALQAMNGFELAGRSIKVGRPDGSGRSGGSSSKGPATAAAATATTLNGAAVSALLGPGAQGSAGAAGGGGISTSQHVTGEQAKIQAQALIQAALGKGTDAMVSAGMIAPGTGMAGAAAVAAVVSDGGGSGDGTIGTMKGDARNRIYIGGVSAELTCDTVKAVFDPFGTISEVRLLPEPGLPEKHRGYGFIQYETHKAAEDAVAQMDGFELLGRKLKVNWASFSSPSELGGFGGGGVGADAVGGAGPAGVRVVGGAAGAGVLRDTSKQPAVPIGTAANLAVATAGLSSGAVTPADADDSNSSADEQQRCVVLTNMVALSEASDPELETEIREEMIKYGSVERVKIYPVVAQDQVRIFVLFYDKASAQRAQSALQGRYFGGHVIAARSYETTKFLAGELNAPLC